MRNRRRDLLTPGGPPRLGDGIRHAQRNDGYIERLTAFYEPVALILDAIQHEREIPTAWLLEALAAVRDLGRPDDDVCEVIHDEAFGIRQHAAVERIRQRLAVLINAENPPVSNWVDPTPCPTA